MDVRGGRVVLLGDGSGCWVLDEFTFSDASLVRKQRVMGGSILQQRRGRKLNRRSRKLCIT